MIGLRVSNYCPGKPASQQELLHVVNDDEDAVVDFDFGLVVVFVQLMLLEELKQLMRQQSLQRCHRCCYETAPSMTILTNCFPLLWARYVVVALVFSGSLLMSMKRHYCSPIFQQQ